MLKRIRLATGVVLFVFVGTHLLNLALGGAGALTIAASTI